MTGLQGRKVFVTGGSIGIGKATALLLARCGAPVVVAARDEARLDAAVEEIRAARQAASQHVSGIALDVGDRAAVNAAAPKVLEAFVVQHGLGLRG